MPSWPPAGSATPRAAHAALGWALEIGIVPAAWMGAWLFLMSAASAVGWWFAPGRLPAERRERAVAISYYACAPLALTPLSLASLWVLAEALDQPWMNQSGMLVPKILLMTALAALPVIQLVTTLTTPL